MTDPLEFKARLADAIQALYGDSADHRRPRPPRLRAGRPWRVRRRSRQGRRRSTRSRTATSGRTSRPPTRTTFVDPAIEEVRKVRYARDESLDPQLVWHGKYPPADEIGEADLDLVTDAPPIYIQEKIDPRVLIENLRRTAERPEDEPELTLFESFDGLDELDQVDFYQHDANWSNRMILGDTLQVMASLAEREKLRGKVQMIYIDPPYGIKFGSNWQVSTRKRDVKDGKLEDATREAEQIKAFRDTWELGIHSYLVLPARPARRRARPADRARLVLRPDRRRERPLVRALLDEVFGARTSSARSRSRRRRRGSFGGPMSCRQSTTTSSGTRETSTQVKYRQLFSRKALGGDGATQYTLVETARWDTSSA